MKIIDLLNKIANGEEVPKYIKYEDNIYEFDTMMGDYYSYKIKKWFSDKYCDGRSLRGCLNDEVEIIEEEKKIPEKLDQTLNRVQIGDDYYRYIMENRFKINEIIDYLDYLKSKGE